jgi:tRNA pseudouridine13 synthase
VHRVTYTLKSRPEDFTVEEEIDLPTAATGRYGLYRLSKRGWNTADVLARIASGTAISPRRIAAGGRKDRHAATVQFVTIEDHRDLSRAEPGWAIEWVGRTAAPMAPARIARNRFRIVLRRVPTEALGYIAANAAAANRTGVPNYFDDQRFGSYDPERGLIAAMMLRGEWEEALKTLLTADRADDPRPERERRRALREHWWRWEECLGFARRHDRPALAFLARRGADYAAALNHLPHDQLSIVLSAYQSHLWNRAAAAIVAREADATIEHPGVAGPYTFPIALSDDAAARLRHAALPTIDAKLVRRDESVAATYRELLAGDRIAPRALRLDRVWRAHLRSSARSLVVVPEGLSPAAEDDELNPGRARVTLSFALPAGSYATMVVKRLTVVV